MAQLEKDPLLQKYPLPGNQHESVGYTWTAYFLFLLLCVASILLTKYFLF